MPVYLSVRRSMCLYVPLCLSDYVSACLSCSLSVCLYACLSVSHLASLPVRTSVYLSLSVCLIMCLHVFRALCPFVCMPIYRSVRLSDCMSFCLSFCVSLSVPCLSSRLSTIPSSPSPCIFVSVLHYGLVLNFKRCIGISRGVHLFISAVATKIKLVTSI